MAGGVGERERDPLKLVEEMHTEASTVPIGTIEAAGCPVYWRHWREDAQ